MKLWKTESAWAACRAKSVASGSFAQASNVLEMAIQDILALHEALERGDDIKTFRSLTEKIRFRGER